MQKHTERKERFLQSEISVMNSAPMINEKSKKILEKKKKHDNEEEQDE